MKWHHSYTLLWIVSHLGYLVVLTITWSNLTGVKNRAVKFHVKYIAVWRHPRVAYIPTIVFIPFWINCDISKTIINFLASQQYSKRNKMTIENVFCHLFWIIGTFSYTFIHVWDAFCFLIDKNRSFDSAVMAFFKTNEINFHLYCTVFNQ